MIGGSGKRIWRILNERHARKESSGMSEQAAQSEDFIPSKDVQFVLQADFDNRSDRLMWNRPQRNLVLAVAEAFHALEQGATEVRIRPYPPHNADRKP